MRSIFWHCCLLWKIFLNYYFINKVLVYVIDDVRPYHTALTGKISAKFPLKRSFRNRILRAFDTLEISKFY